MCRSVTSLASTVGRRSSWLKTASILSDDTAPSASLDLWRLRPLLCNPERRPSRLEAYHGLRSPPQAGPKLRIFHFQPPGGGGDRRGADEIQEGEAAGVAEPALLTSRSSRREPVAQ